MIAEGELFFIVDSDDYLLPTSLKLINHYYETIKGNENFAGVAGYRAYPSGKSIAAKMQNEILDTDTIGWFKHAKGDMAEVWRTDVLRKYPFPVFKGERFITEAVVWNEIAKKYKLRYFNESVYLCEYLPDGLSRNIRRHHRESPQGTMLYYSTLVRDKRFSIKRHIIDTINFWRYVIPYKGKKTKLPFWCYLLKPVGYVFYRLDIKHENKSC